MGKPIRPGPAEVLDDLSPELRGRVKSELLPGERILWAARPYPRSAGVGRSYVGPTVIVACAWGLCVLFLAGYFGAYGPPFREFELSLALFGLFAGVVGTLLALAAFASWASDRDELSRIAREFYILTDRRALIWRPPQVERPGRDDQAVEIHSIYRGEVGHIHRVEDTDGFGDIQFTLWDKAQGVAGPNLRLERVFQVRRVEDLVRATLIGPTPPSEDA